MLQKAKSSRRTPGGGDKAWASEAAVEGVKRLRQEVVTLLRSLLVTLRQDDTERLSTLLTKLQDKTHSLLNVIEPSLVEEAYEFLDQIRVPQNPSRILTLATRTYSSYNISGYLSPETALDLELMSPDIPNMSLCSQPESKHADADKVNFTISSAKEVDIMDGQENSIYRPTDEPEPWDLIQLNVQASIMCLNSKIKSFCNRAEERRKKREREDTVKRKLSNSGLESNGTSEIEQRGNIVISNDSDKSSPSRSKVNVSEAQIINTIQTQNTSGISSSVGSDCSQTSGRSGTSSLGVARAGESQRSSCSATPDVSPCEEDSGIGLERAVSEVERTDCISEGGLSADDERKEELLPLDKPEVRRGEKDTSMDKPDIKRGEKEEFISNSELRYGCDASIGKSSKLESIMEQSIEDLDSSFKEIQLDNQSEVDNCVELVVDTERDLNCEDSESKDSEQILTISSPQTNDLSSDEVQAESDRQKERESHRNSENQSDIDSKCDVKKVDDKTTCPGDQTQEPSNSSSSKQNAKGVSTDIPEEVDWVGEVRPSMRKLKQAMDGLMRTARLVHSVFRLQQTPEAAQQAHTIKYRRDICFSQALTTLVTGLMTRLWCRKADPLFITVLAHLGPLAEFECLVSCHGNDEGMLSDMVVAVEDLGTVEFVLVSGGGRRDSGHRSHSDGAAPPPPPQQLPTPHITGNRCGVRVVLPVPEHVLSLLPSPTSQPDHHPSFTVTPVLFNIGINEEATLAEKLGTDGPQTRNNQDSFERLSQYYHRFKKLPLPQENSRRMTSLGGEVHLVDVIDQLGVEVASQRSKNPRVLQLAARCCRAMAGLRFTSCKSGKDRTGMSATLEQANILAAEYDLAETEFQRALNCMRSEGTRLENCHKNIGSRKFAFSALNLTMFPKQYRPPSGTYGSKLT